MAHVTRLIVVARAPVLDTEMFEPGSLYNMIRNRKIVPWLIQCRGKTSAQVNVKKYIM